MGTPFRTPRAQARRAIALLARARPDFLIVGTQKGGTTSLHAYLAQHPQIVSGRGPKELHFFDLYYQRGLGWYLWQFPFRFRAGSRLCFEATPDYLCHHVVPERIRRDLGRRKLIMVLREPAERAYSAWKMWHDFASRPEQAARADRRSFAEAIAADLAAPDGARDRHFYYVAMGRYAEHIETYRRHFPAEDMLVLDYRDMSRDLHAFLNRICRFLDIAPFARTTTDALEQTRYWVGPRRDSTPEEAATLARLRTYYAPHNERLFELLGSRFDW